MKRLVKKVIKVLQVSEDHSTKGTFEGSQHECKGNDVRSEAYMGDEMATSRLVMRAARQRGLREEKGGVMAGAFAIFRGVEGELPGQVSQQQSVKNYESWLRSFYFMVVMKC